MLVLPILYVSGLLLCIILCFFKKKWRLKYRKGLINIHLILLLVVIFNISGLNLRGSLAEGLIVIAFLLTATSIFSLFRNTLTLWKKIYFGLFIFYPLFAILIFFLDRIAFAIFAIPFLLTLILPETRFQDEQYELREPVVGLMSTQQLQLIKKGLISERLLGTCTNQDVVSLDISDILIVSQKGDSTIAVLTSGGKKYDATFYRRL